MEQSLNLYSSKRLIDGEEFESVLQQQETKD